MIEVIFPPPSKKIIKKMKRKRKCLGLFFGGEGWRGEDVMATILNQCDIISEGL